MPRPPPPAARLDDHRIAHVSSHRAGVLDTLDPAVGTRNARNAETLHGVLGRDLVAHDANVLGLRAYEREPVILDDLCEPGVFTQKPIARVDRLCAGDFAGGDDVGNGQVACGAGRRADADRLVRHAHVHGVRVGGGMPRQHWPRPIRDRRV